MGHSHMYCLTTSYSLQSAHFLSLAETLKSYNHTVPGLENHEIQPQKSQILFTPYFVLVSFFSEFRTT